MYTSILKYLVPSSVVRSVEESLKVVNRSKKMAKVKDKDSDHPHIDFKNCVQYGLLKQIRYVDEANPDADTPKLVGAWSCILKPQQTKSFVKFINEYIAPYDSQGFPHVKRLQKIGIGKDFVLKGILCSTDFQHSKDDLLSFIKQYAEHDMRDIPSVDLSTIQIPSNPPIRKDIWQDWSSKYWPMSWKGNPNDQFLKETTFNIKAEKARVKKLLGILEENVNSSSLSGTIPVATMAVNPNNDEIVATTFDCRFEHPLHHSVMKVIEKVAEKEKENRLKDDGEVNENSNYLLNGLVIYTTHEPCVMCSMALVHSRIKRVIFLKPMKSGGLETNYQMGDRDSLNWKFETWRWLDTEDLETLENIEKKSQFASREINV